MIVNNLHVRRPWRSIEPLEANPPLVVDANAVLSLATANQRLKTIAGQGGQVAKRRGGFEAVELQPSGTLKPGKSFDPLSGSEVSRPLVAVADDHSAKLSRITRYVKRTGFPFTVSRPESLISNFAILEVSFTVLLFLISFRRFIAAGYRSSRLP